MWFKIMENTSWTRISVGLYGEVNYSCLSLDQHSTFNTFKRSSTITDHSCVIFQKKFQAKQLLRSFFIIVE